MKTEGDALPTRVQLPGVLKKLDFFLRNIESCVLFSTSPSKYSEKKFKMRCLIGGNTVVMYHTRSIQLHRSTGYVYVQGLSHAAAALLENVTDSIV
jgi:hypothetical protein